MTERAISSNQVSTTGRLRPRFSWISDRLLATVFLSPTMLLLLFITIFPLIWSLYLSFTKYSVISDANTGPLWIGFKNYGNILMKRLKVQGFIVLDYIPRFAEAYRALTQLHGQGKLKWNLHQVDGLENAVKAVRMLYTGGNNGKLMVKVA